MKWILVMAVMVVFCAGCESIGLRNTATESQKQVAWHGHLSAMAVEKEGTGPHSPAAKKLVQATQVALTDTGLPKNPNIVDYETTAAQAQKDAALKPTTEQAFQAVEQGLSLAAELAIVFGVGGTSIGGLKLAEWIKKARQKSDALKEIVQNNELLKKADAAAYTAMKNAQRNQTEKTKQVVAAVKTNAA